MGVSSATGPTPNAGYEAAAFQRIAMHVNALSELIPLIGATSEAGQALLKALTSLSKVVPVGASSPTSDRNAIENLALRNQQNSSDLQALRSGGQQQPAKPPGMPQQQPQQAA